MLAQPSAVEINSSFYRPHKPTMYHSPYDEAYLDRVAARMTAAARDADAVWCIFDNTARGAATVNALDLLSRLSS